VFGLPGTTYICSSNVVVSVGFEVLTEVVMKNSSFWDITPCSLLKVNRCFRGVCRLHLQG
jgi:hypothetical protein